MAASAGSPRCPQILSLESKFVHSGRVDTNLFEAEGQGELKTGRRQPQLSFGGMLPETVHSTLSPFHGRPEHRDTSDVTRHER